MLSFLRARRPPSRACVAHVGWSGRVLDVARADIASGEEIALELDGCFFASARADAGGRVRFEFPFAPASVARARLRRGRDGEFIGEASELRFDTAPSPSRIVPLGTDLPHVHVAIVVPVYDAPGSVGRCLDSVLRHTTGRASLIVIDDASPDAAVAPLLDRYAGIEGVRVLRNERNRGFTATANRGIAEAGRADVVLLNADTEVGPGWLTGLRRAARCADDVATATAVSDNAGAFSVPELERENALPDGWTLDEAARALWHGAGLEYPELPTGNGFCLYLRRSVIDAVGALDEAAFPQGYGEENDFCQRASARGLRHVIAGNVFVHHERSRSFGHERRALLGAAGMAVLRERWPRYEADVGAALLSFERRVLDWRVRRLFADKRAAATKPRVLCLGRVSLSDRHEARAWTIGSDDESFSSQLQAQAIDAIVAAVDVPASWPRIATALGIPFARVAHGEDAERALGAAMAALRSFPEKTR